MDDTGSGESAGLRSDAARNLERLLAAAVRAGLASGRPVPMSTIAAEAGVGVGTLYRRFRDRQALVEALQQRAYRLLIDIVRRAADVAPNGLTAIEMFLVGSFEIRRELVLPLHGAPPHRDAATDRLACELRDAITELVHHGHRDGTVRRDVTAWTVIAFGALVAQPLDDDDDRWERTATEQRGVFLRGIAARTTEHDNGHGRLLHIKRTKPSASA